MEKGGGNSDARFNLSTQEAEAVRLGQQSTVVGSRIATQRNPVFKQTNKQTNGGSHP